jgi:serine/threonine protein phosphatase PrpC
MKHLFRILLFTAIYINALHNVSCMDIDLSYLKPEDIRVSSDVCGSDDSFTWATSNTGGRRWRMEDTNFPSKDQSPVVPELGYFWGVYDGHGGRSVAIHVVTGHESIPSLHENIKIGLIKYPADIKKAIVHGYLKTDIEVHALSEVTGSSVMSNSGTTILTALVRDGRLNISWAGDSRGIVCGGPERRLLFETKDHKPDDEREKTRIEAAGGSVDWGRVCGVLSVARSIGDWGYAEGEEIKLDDLVCRKPVSSVPDHLEPIDLRDVDFFVLACDGLWNALSSEDVYRFVYEQMGTRTSSDITKEQAEDIAKNLIVQAVTAYDQDGNPKSIDNVTATIVFVKHR